jgi:hypothetical protein
MTHNWAAQEIKYSEQHMPEHDYEAGCDCGKCLDFAYAEVEKVAGTLPETRAAAIARDWQGAGWYAPTIHAGWLEVVYGGNGVAPEWDEWDAAVVLPSGLQNVQVRP